MACSSSLVSGVCSATQHSRAMARFDPNHLQMNRLGQCSCLFMSFSQVFGNWSYGTIIFTVLVFTVTLKVSEDLS